MVMPIEQVVNLWDLTIEDLCRLLLTTKEGYDLDTIDDVDKLLSRRSGKTASASIRNIKGQDEEATNTKFML
jgi:hypothetical protein